LRLHEEAREELAGIIEDLADGIREGKLELSYLAPGITFPDNSPVEGGARINSGNFTVELRVRTGIEATVECDELGGIPNPPCDICGEEISPDDTPTTFRSRHTEGKRMICGDCGDRQGDDWFMSQFMGALDKKYSQEEA
jgi:hypothetical protein